MTQTRARFWDFSLTFYSQPRVADLCLGLQEDFGLDVNLILFGIWYGQHFGNMPDPLLQDAISCSRNWLDNVVQPLRNVRTTMKKDSALRAQFPGESYENLREGIKEMELGAEKLQQELLQQLAEQNSATGNDASGDNAALSNLLRLCKELQPGRDNSLRERLQEIVTVSESLADEQENPA